MGCACHVPGPVLNVRKRRVSPLLQDPTRTGWIRRAWIADFRRRFKRIAKALYDFIVTKDALGLRHKAPGAVFNVQPRQYQFLTDANKLKAFQQWLKEQLEAGLISVPAGQNPNEPWTSPYIQSAYRQGLQNAYEAEKSILGVTQDEEFFGRSVDQFLRDAFSQPETTSKVQLLATRSYEQLNGFNASTGSALNRIMAQAIIDGKGPASIYKDMSKQLGISERRALTIARTETIYAHAEGSLDSFEALGVEDVGIQSEFSTAGDERVCPICQAMEGRVYSVKEARGVIPVHPACRCSWLPVVAVPKGF